MRLVGNDFGTYYWQVTATDRVGNSVTTDGDEDERGNQPFKFTVDDAGPKVDPDEQPRRAHRRLLRARRRREGQPRLDRPGVHQQ